MKFPTEWKVRSHSCSKAPSSEPTLGGLLSIQKITFQLFVVHVAQGLTLTTWGAVDVSAQLQSGSPVVELAKLGAT